MKVIISSKALAIELNKIDLDSNEIKSVRYSSNYLFLYTNKEMLEIFCAPGDGDNRTIEQGNRRWDHVKELMNQVDEQPIVLKITKELINIIFQY